MLFKRLMVLIFFSPFVYSQEKTAPSLGSALTLLPNKCVALHKGRTCYAELKFQWKVKIKGDYCLYEEALTSPIKCWRQSNRGYFEYNFQSSVSRSYILVAESTKETIAKGGVSVNWVHKSPDKRRRWRIF